MRESFPRRLVALGYDNYEHYLKSAHWREVKRRYRAERPWVCYCCGATQRLALHHCTYSRIGRERLSDLTPVCKACHSLIHQLEDDGHHLSRCHKLVHQINKGRKQRVSTKKKRPRGLRTKPMNKRRTRPGTFHCMKCNAPIPSFGRCDDCT